MPSMKLSTIGKSYLTFNENIPRGKWNCLSQMYTINKNFAERLKKRSQNSNDSFIFFWIPICPKNKRIRKIILKNLKIRSTEKFIHNLDQDMKNHERSQNHHRSNNSFIRARLKETTHTHNRISNGRRNNPLFDRVWTTTVRFLFIAVALTFINFERTRCRISS